MTDIWEQITNEIDALTEARRRQIAAFEDALEDANNVSARRVAAAGALAQEQLDAMMLAAVRYDLVKRKIAQLVTYFVAGEVTAGEARGELEAAVESVNQWQLGDPMPGWVKDEQGR